MDVAPGLSRSIAIRILDHGEVRNTVLYLVNFQELTVERLAHILHNTPARAEQVTDVHEVG